MTKATRRMVLLAVILFAGSFAGTIATRSQMIEPASRPAGSPLTQWLHLDAEQAVAVNKHDPRFSEDLAQLRGKLADERSKLIAMFENVDTGDEELREQIEAVIEAHNRQERRVADYLITVRHLLNPAQQQRLFSLCADNIRYCWRQQRWRHGQRQGEIGGPGGGGGGRHGQGQGRGWRGGRGQGGGPGGWQEREADPIGN